jgi:hypothetical protein
MVQRGRARQRAANWSERSGAPRFGRATVSVLLNSGVLRPVMNSHRHRPPQPYRKAIIEAEEPMGSLCLGFPGERRIGINAVQQEPALLGFVSLNSTWSSRRHSPRKQKERKMGTKNLVLVSCAALVLSIAAAQAGPCNTGKSAQDAGSGPTPGHTGQTIGSATSTNPEHPPTSTMNRTTGDVAASSQDAQKQMQGEPTATQQGQGAKPSAKPSDQDC